MPGLRTPLQLHRTRRPTTGGADKLGQTLYPAYISSTLATLPAYPPRYFRDLPAAEIEATYQRALKAIKASGHHQLEPHKYKGTQEFTVRLGVKTT
jgi:hypothetical protein